MRGRIGVIIGLGARVEQGGIGNREREPQGGAGRGVVGVFAIRKPISFRFSDERFVSD